MNAFFETKKPPEKKLKRTKRALRTSVRALRITFDLALFLALAAMISATALYLYGLQDYSTRLSQRYPDLPESSFVYDARGEKIGEIIGEENRITVGPEDLGEHLPKAVVAIEDRRFYEHAGVDFAGIARAAYTDVRAGQIVEGGSTITEQLMKNLFVAEEEWDEVSYRRRFEQASLALAYEQRHTKREVLTAYLNTVYFGDGAYGAEVAAKNYFGKSARELTLAEAATLAGFLHAPSTYLPEDGEQSTRATERRNEVLELMREQGMISTAERRRAAAEPVEFTPDEPFVERPAYEPFLDKVRREAEETFGEEAVTRGGLEIRTTLDPTMQREAISASDEVLYAPEDPSAAVATVAPGSGAIRTLAGQEGGFNLPLDARRQPGSSFKPFVLATALREGISPKTTYVSRNLEVEIEGQTYPISNYGGLERGRIPVADAMAESDNTVYVQLATDVGYEDVAEMAGKLGITTPVEPYPSSAIGGLGTGVSPLDMASAYATFAAGGVYREPYVIESTERRSFGTREMVYDHRRGGRRVMSTNEAAALTEVLRGVVHSGTASRYHDLDSELGRPSAGKTGTTDEFADAWYVGYTPRLSTAVWVGYPDSPRTMSGVHGIEEAGGETLPLDVFSRYMAQATAGQPPLGFPEADPSEFEVTGRGYAVEPHSPLQAGDVRTLSANDPNYRVQSIVDEALPNAFGSR